MRDPDHIIYFRPRGRRAARRRLLARSGHLGRRPTRWPSRATLFDARHGALRRVLGGRAATACPRCATPEIAKVVNGARGLHPRRRVHPGRDRGRRPVGGGRLLRARAGRRGRRRQGHGRVDRRRAARVRRGRRWTSAASARTTQSRAYARVRALDAYSRYYDVVYPHEERDAGRPLRVPPAYARLAELGRELRREGRLGARRTGSSANAARRRRVAAPARLGRAVLVAGDRRRVPGRARHRRALRPVVVRQARRARAGRGRGAVAAVRERRRPAESGTRRLHPAAQRRAAASRPT